MIAVLLRFGVVGSLCALRTNGHCEYIKSETRFFIVGGRFLLACSRFHHISAHRQQSSHVSQDHDMQRWIRRDTHAFRFPLLHAYCTN